MKNKLLVLITLALAALTLYLFFQMFERYEEEDDQGWSRKALRNPYLAAELYAREFGNEVTSIDSITKFDDIEGISTLFVAKSGQIVSKPRLDQLLTWVALGNDLIVAAQGGSDWYSDKVLERLKLELYATEYDGRPIFDENGNAIDYSDSPPSDKGNESDSLLLSEALREYNRIVEAEADAESDEKKLSPEHRIRTYEDGVEPHQLTHLRFGGVDEGLRIEFLPDRAFDISSYSRDDSSNNTDGSDSDSDGSADSDQNSSDDGLLYPLADNVIYMRGGSQGVNFLQLRFGRGMVTLLSDGDVFTNENIDKFDHAFLWQVLAGRDNRMAILYATNMPSLLSIMLAFMPELLAAALLLFCLWLWYRSGRFGPINSLQVTTRRSLLEHLFARAFYFWRGGSYEQLLTPLRSELLLHAGRVLPEFHHAEEARRVALLAQASHQPEADVAQALQVSSSHTESSFIHQVTLLQRIRKAI